MNVMTFLASTVYSMLQAGAGLLIHPYQTMQYLVEEKVFIWLSFLPSVFGIFCLGIWWIALKVFFLELPFIGLWAFALLWLGAFFIFWQILLLYLLVRFWISLR